MKLYELSNQMRELLEKYEVAINYEPQKNEQGEYIDFDGNVIEESYLKDFKQAMIEAYATSLECIEIDFKEKAEAIGCYVKELQIEANALKEQEQIFKQRREQKERTINSLKEYILKEMKTVNVPKIDRPQAFISIRNNPESVQIINEKAYTQWALENNKDLLKFKPEISKTNIKNAIKNGAEIPYCSLGRTQSLIIK